MPYWFPQGINILTSYVLYVCIINYYIFVTYLQKSLPLLRQSLMLKEMVIDGIRPPQISALTQSTVVLANQQQGTVKNNNFST